MARKRRLKKKVLERQEAAIHEGLGVSHLILPCGNSRDYCGLIALKYNSNRTADSNLNFFTYLLSR